MDFGINTASAVDMLRKQLLMLLQTVRGGAVDFTRAKVPFSVLLPDFEVNRVSLTNEHLTEIEGLAEILLSHPALEIEMLVGRASQTGDESNNISLSKARAQAVADELERLSIYPPAPTIGLGSSEPIQNVPNVESEFNRSVEISLWYDLSYHFPEGGGSIWDDKPPADFWRDYIPGNRYDRAALVVELVYDNIDTLYLPIHDSTVGTMNAITAWQDDALVRSRALLGYYKQTGSDAYDIQLDIAAFNQLLRDNGLSPNDFTGAEISDAEHFVTAAVMTMVPLLGLVVGPTFSLAWEGGQGAIGYVRTRSTASLKYNMEQFIGADMAGAAYGMMKMRESLP